MVVCSWRCQLLKDIPFSPVRLQMSACCRLHDDCDLQLLPILQSEALDNCTRFVPAKRLTSDWLAALSGTWRLQTVATQFSHAPGYEDTMLILVTIAIELIGRERGIRTSH